jgi:hypothetical protein
MRREWTDTSVTTTLENPTEDVEYDVECFDGWIVGVTLTKNGSTNAVWYFQASPDGGTTWEKVTYQTGPGEAGSAIGAGGDVTTTTESEVFYYFDRATYFPGFSHTTHARKLKLYWDTEGLGNSATLAVRLVSPFNNKGA